MGRKTTYKPEVVKTAAKIASQGALDSEIIAALGCTNSTFYRWLNKHKEFREAIAQARQPKNLEADVKKAAWRKQKMEEWLDFALQNKGSIEICEGDGLGSYTKHKTDMPDMRWCDRLLGIQGETELFEVNITLAVPEPEDDADDLGNAAEVPD